MTDLGDERLVSAWLAYWWMEPVDHPDEAGPEAAEHDLASLAVHLARHGYSIVRTEP